MARCSGQSHQLKIWGARLESARHSVMLRKSLSPSAYGALRVPILKVLHLLFRGSSTLCRQRGSGWLSFSILKHTVLHIAFARRGRELPASHGPGSDLSSRAAAPGPCSSPPPLRLLRS
ncbi:hypothetical protein NDU88_001556 [Pleurodeles waltl]|uniref:Uncharacterized protein n=1 Tax=Pleurodeles waltl TaxID=8319 RepID=A0AAV7P453_PLEWA|nr:hypothetical protein NDU88_001556 [Pleurodeles waltl]